MVTDYAGAEPPISVNLPDSILALGAASLELGAAAMALEAPQTALPFWLLTHDVQQIDRGQFRPVTPLSQTVLDSLAWYRLQGY